MLKGYMVRERLESPALGHANVFDDRLRLAIRCLPALGVVLFFVVTEAFSYQLTGCQVTRRCQSF